MTEPKPPAATPAPDPQQPAPAPSPEAKLVAYLRATSALADEALAHALAIPAPLPLVQHIAAASKALHGAVLGMLGPAE